MHAHARTHLHAHTVSHAALAPAPEQSGLRPRRDGPVWNTCPVPFGKREPQLQPLVAWRKLAEQHGA